MCWSCSYLLCWLYIVGALFESIDTTNDKWNDTYKPLQALSSSLSRVVWMVLKTKTKWRFRVHVFASIRQWCASKEEPTCCHFTTSLPFNTSTIDDDDTKMLSGCGMHLFLLFFPFLSLSPPPPPPFFLPPPPPPPRLIKFCCPERILFHSHNSSGAKEVKPETVRSQVNITCTVSLI